jgi:hypothetical protein
MVGFWGMYFLCRKYIITNQHSLSSAIVAILFAILPFWSSGCLSVAAQPLVLYSFLRIRDGKKDLWDWIVLILYPFVSSFVVFGIFFYALLFGIFCIDWYRKRKINIVLFCVLVVLSILSLIAMYREIFAIFVDATFISHRVEFVKQTLPLSSVLRRIIGFLLFGQNHAPSNHLIILLFSFFMLIYGWLKKGRLNKKLTLILILFFLIACYSGLMSWEPIDSITMSIPLFKLFNINRFYTLFPLLTFLCLAYALNELPKKNGTNLILVLLFVTQMTYSIKNDFTYAGLAKKMIGKENASTITFNEFYSVALFQEINRYIGEPSDSYKVVALGFHPAVLQYNGFYTIDGYCPNYDVQYKHKFGELIKGELEKNRKLADYFYGWGSRCYIFDNEGGKFDNYKTQKIKTESLDINYDILNSMNCKYIISSMKINNLGKHLEFQSVFENNIWAIYLYKVL